MEILAQVFVWLCCGALALLVAWLLHRRVHWTLLIALGVVGLAVGVHLKFAYNVPELWDLQATSLGSYLGVHLLQFFWFASLALAVRSGIKVPSTGTNRGGGA